MTLLNLQKWLEAQSDGDWEHEYSVKISTTDNPGWSISIPIVRTSLEDYIYEHDSFIDDMDWYKISSNGKYFTSYCSLNRIEYVIEFFLNDFFKMSNRKDVIYSIFYQHRLENSLDIFLPLQAISIDYQTFLVISLEEDFINEIKVKNVQEFEMLENLNEENLKNIVLGLINKKVQYKSEMFYDSPAIVIQSNV
ncbi:immunity 53 family protein [Chryseobacterium sp. WG14]|uniref:Imm53 family immunity protein n=1 Tax=Chryseobacterium sp. WG14 TaxID=2926909 RepID=UPI000648F3D8|nr:Imm53 family immunity protein [Chryseobacterium sp. WG14]MCQ9640883.1 immunity 53 family protein [Chryseobacterium sp. WG14]